MGKCNVCERRECVLFTRVDCHCSFPVKPSGSGPRGRGSRDTGRKQGGDAARRIRDRADAGAEPRLVHPGVGQAAMRQLREHRPLRGSPADASTGEHGDEPVDAGDVLLG